MEKLTFLLSKLNEIYSIIILILFIIKVSIFQTVYLNLLKFKIRSSNTFLSYQNKLLFLTSITVLDFEGNESFFIRFDPRLRRHYEHR